jgi:RNA polymerase sigma-B factor
MSVDARERRHRETTREDLPARFAEYRKTRDRRLRNELVEAHYGLAVRLAQDLAGRGERLDDLIQVALYGLVKAVERFDLDRGVAFSTFAVHTIRGELKRHFRDHFWAVHVTRAPKNLSLRLNGARMELAQQLGRMPRPSELAAHLGVDEDDLLQAVEARRAVRCDSLDAAIDDAAPRPLATVDPGYESVEHRALVASLLRRLRPRDRLIVELRFIHGMKQHEIGRTVGISQMHVSRILRRAVDELRAATGELVADEAV